MSPSLPGVPVARSVSHARARRRRRPGRAGLPRRRAGRGVRREPAGMLRRGPGPAGPARIRHSLPWCRAVHGGGAVRAHRDRGRDRMGARRPAGDPDSGRGEAEHTGRAVAPHPEPVVQIFAALARRASRVMPGRPARRAHPGPVTFPLAGPGCLPAIAVDGKAVRGAAGEDGLSPYLLAAAPTAAHGARRTADRAKDERGPRARAAAAETERALPVAGYVVTDDAEHTVRAHARLICELGAAPCSPWSRTRPGCGGAGRAGLGAGAGAACHRGERPRRRERHTIQVMNAPDCVKARFPQVGQFGWSSGT